MQHELLTTFIFSERPNLSTSHAGALVCLALRGR